jgi:phosphohistidine phosphatase
MDNDLLVKRLLILRHAKSSWGDSSLDDWQRPLSPRGVRDAPGVGKLLRKHALVPDLIITSDAVRARTTAHAVAEAAGYDRELVVDPRLYHANPDDLLAVLQGLPDDSARAMIVGHNPGLEDLIERLAGEHHAMATATLAHLALPIDRWSALDDQTGGTIVNIWRPGEEPA